MMGFGAKLLIFMVRPSGFEPPTFCSGGIAARRNLLILQIATQRFSRFSDYSLEKLLGKLLGRFSLSHFSSESPDVHLPVSSGKIGHPGSSRALL